MGASGACRPGVNAGAAAARRNCSVWPFFAGRRAREVTGQQTCTKPPTAAGSFFGWGQGNNDAGDRRRPGLSLNLGDRLPQTADETNAARTAYKTERDRWHQQTLGLMRCSARNLLLVETNNQICVCEWLARTDEGARPKKTYVHECEQARLLPAESTHLLCCWNRSLQPQRTELLVRAFSLDPGLYLQSLPKIRRNVGCGGVFFLLKKQRKKDKSVV